MLGQEAELRLQAPLVSPGSKRTPWRAQGDWQRLLSWVPGNRRLLCCRPLHYYRVASQGQGQPGPISSETWEVRGSGLPGPPAAPIGLGLPLPSSVSSLVRRWPGGRHMLRELLNRKSASRSSRVPFHVVSLIPRAGFQKRFTVSVLQSYAPFNVGVFQEVGGEQLQSKHVCFTSASCGLRPGRGGGSVAPRLGGCGPWVDATLGQPSSPAC